MTQFSSSFPYGILKFHNKIKSQQSQSNHKKLFHVKRDVNPCSKFVSRRVVTFVHSKHMATSPVAESGGILCPPTQDPTKSADGSTTPTNNTENANLNTSETLPLPADTNEKSDTQTVSDVSSLSFQQYFDNQDLVPPKKKMGLLFGVAASGIVPDFLLTDLTESPFKDIVNIRPSRDMLRGEISRRDCYSSSFIH